MIPEPIRSEIVADLNAMLEEWMRSVKASGIVFNQDKVDIDLRVVAALENLYDICKVNPAFGMPCSISEFTSMRVIVDAFLKMTCGGLPGWTASRKLGILVTNTRIWWVIFQETGAEERSAWHPNYRGILYPDIIPSMKGSSLT